MFKEDEDFYIKINDGEIVTENKSDSIEFIKEDTKPEQVDTVPHYNSPEYAEYINQINRQSLREINSEDINNIEATSNIRKEIKEKYPKKKVQLCIFALIIILFIAIVAVSGSMMKSVSNTNTASTQLSGVNEEFKFLTDVTIASASDSINSYDTLKELASTRDKLNYSEYKERIQLVKENAQRNLNDVNSLSSYIEVKNYKEIISSLEERYVNLINLCDNLLEARNTNTINTYNKYVPKEVSIVGNLNNAIIKKASELNIDYKVENEKIILYID